MIPAYRDASQPVDARVDDLLARMTRREKVGQLNQRLLGWRTWTREADAVRTTDLLHEQIAHWSGIGAIYGMLRADAWSGQHWANGAHPDLSREVTAAVQERVVAGSRLGIPALFVEEAPHGHQALGSRMFPVNLAAAATWEPALVEQAATHVARELRSRGAHLALVSGLDILRDPRWGRSEECFGEDPLLAALLVRAQVRGMTREPGLAVVLKHFAGQGAGMGGRNSSGAAMGPRELAEIHLAAARAGVDEGALGIMAAYNDLDGIPCCANEGLLTDTLRTAWGFEGIVMADMGAVDRLMRSAPSAAAAGAIALRAGVDLSMCDVSFEALEEAVDAGLANEADVDRAARRVLALKFRLGLFDPPLALPAFPAPASVVDFAAASLTLLQNRGDLLPPAARPDRVAVIGPNGDDFDSLLGDYVPPPVPGAGITVLGAIRELLGPRVTHEPGCALTAPIEGGLDRASAAANAADLVVLVLGSTGVRGYDDDFAANGAGRLGGRPPAATTGEGFDVAEVQLPAAQRELVAAVAAAGTPTVAVIVSGRPLGIDLVAEMCDAVIYAWYPGPQGGRAIAELVIGGREPVGRLPVSLPRSSGTLPVAYNERLEATLRYVDSEAAARFAFGSGLGYTEWRLGDPVTDTDAASAAGIAGLAVRVSLANIGGRRGSQLVQLYCRVRIPGILPRRAILVGFARATLDPGTEEQLVIPILPDAIAGLGLSAGAQGVLELWCSMDGPGEPGERIRRIVLVGSGGLS